MTTLLEKLNEKYRKIHHETKREALVIWLKKQGFAFMEDQTYKLESLLRVNVTVSLKQDYISVAPKTFSTEKEAWLYLSSQKYWYGTHSLEELIDVIETITLALIDQAEC